MSQSASNGGGGGQGRDGNWWQPGARFPLAPGCVKGGVHLHVAVAVKVHDYDHDHDYAYVPAASHRQMHVTWTIAR
jgi:hypothetical protein